MEVKFNKKKEVKIIKKSLKKSKKKLVKIKDRSIKFFKEKDKKIKLKKFLKKIYATATSKRFLRIELCALPFIIMDLATKLFASEIEFFSVFKLAPRVFSFGYIFLLLGIVFNLKKKASYYTYIFSFSLFYIIFLIQNIYYDATKNFFSFSLAGLASEGSSYFLDVVTSCSIWVYIVSIIILILFFLSLRFFPVSRGLNKKNIFKTIIGFIAIHFLACCLLGSANRELTWNTWRNPKNVYNNFNDSNKCMAIAGLYEYTFRDLYVIYIRKEPKRSETENAFLEEVFNAENNSISKNKYTGIFKDKNVIFLQMEGIDNWLLTEETMPNTYGLLKNSINFTNHYSFVNGGGSTFNSEFAVNVGYMTPFTYPVNAYTLNKNDFPYSMANLLKIENYSIKAFHMNSSEYYSRGINYSNFGYDRYFGLKDFGTYKDKTYELDRELILNETFYNEMFKNKGKFVNYIITYSTHMPFDRTSGVCQQLLSLEYQDKLKGLSNSEIEDFFDKLNISEEECVKKQAKETDYMVGLLIKALKDNKLYDDTIIVAFTDHYLYTIDDQEILKQYKDTKTNLVNHTPFFIWSSDRKGEQIKKVTSQLNILPIVLNMLGIEYNEKWYLFQDVFSSKYEPLAIFSDLSWYDGKVYVVDGMVKNNKKINKDVLDKKNNLVEYYIKKNDLVLKYNYFKEIIN